MTVIEETDSRFHRAVKTCRAYTDGMPLLEALEAIQLDVRDWEDQVPLDVRESYIYLMGLFRNFFAPVNHDGEVE